MHTDAFVSRTGTGSLTASFRPTPAGTFCDRQCFANGLTASQFKKLGTTLSTFACGVSNNDVGAVSGYQLSNATTTCSVAGGSTVQNSPDYGCLCQVRDLMCLMHRLLSHCHFWAGFPKCSKYRFYPKQTPSNNAEDSLSPYCSRVALMPV